MTSELKVDKISPASGTSFTLGDSGDTFTVPSGATLDTSSSTLSLPSTIITSQTEKSSLVDADKFLISDSAASGALKYVQKSNLPSGTHVLLATATGTNVSGFNINSIFSSTYKVYRMIIRKAMPVQNDVSVRLRMRNASGGEVSSSLYKYVRQRLRAGAVDNYSNQSESFVEIMGGIFNEDEGGGANCEMIFNVDRDTGGNNAINGYWTAGVARNNDEASWHHGSFYYDDSTTDEPAAGLKLYTSDGNNFSRCNVAVYGITGAI